MSVFFIGGKKIINSKALEAFEALSKDKHFKTLHNGDSNFTQIELEKILDLKRDKNHQIDDQDLHVHIHNIASKKSRITVDQFISLAKEYKKRFPYGKKVASAFWLKSGNGKLEEIANFMKTFGLDTNEAEQIIFAFEDAGITDPDLIFKLVIRIASKNDSFSTPDTLRALPKALQSIHAAGITDSNEIVKLFYKITSAGSWIHKRVLGVGSFSCSIFEALPSILECGITKTDDIIDLAEEIISEASGASGYAFMALPEILNSGIVKPDKIVTLIKIAIGPGDLGTAGQFEALPNALISIRSAGITDPDEIIDLLGKTVEAAGTSLYAVLRAIEAIPAIIRAGITNPNEIVGLINKVKSLTDTNTSNALWALKYLFDEAGITELNEVTNLITKIAPLAKKSSGWAFNVIPTLVDFGIVDLDKIATLLKNIVTKSEKDSISALASLPGVLVTLFRYYSKDPDIIYNLINKRVCSLKQGDDVDHMLRTLAFNIKWGF